MPASCGPSPRSPRSRPRPRPPRRRRRRPATIAVSRWPPSWRSTLSVSPALFAFRRCFLGFFGFLFLVALFLIFRLRLVGGDKARLDADGVLRGRSPGSRFLVRSISKEPAARPSLGSKLMSMPCSASMRAELAALLVEDVDRHLARHLHGDGGGAALLAFLFQAAQHAQGGGFGGAHQAGAGAMGAGDGRAGDDAGAQALARHFHQAELGDLADLHPGAVVLDRIAQPPFHLAVVAAFFHVDEVDDDQAGQVAQAQLAADFAGRFQIGLARGLLDRMFAGGAAGIHVDRDQRLGLVDDDIAARFQGDGGREHRIQLVFDMHALEERHAVLVLVDDIWHGWASACA